MQTILLYYLYIQTLKKCTISKLKHPSYPFIIWPKERTELEPQFSPWLKKCIHVIFTNKRIENPTPININCIVLSCENTIKYVRMTIDIKLRWKDYMKQKINEPDIGYCIVFWKTRSTYQYEITYWYITRS